MQNGKNMVLENKVNGTKSHSGKTGSEDLTVDLTVEASNLNVSDIDITVESETSMQQLQP